MPVAMTDPRVAVVVITWRRRDEALACLRRLRDLPERPHVGLRNRPRPPAVEARLAVLDGTQRRSTARRYVS